MYIRFLLNIGECIYWVSFWGYKEYLRCSNFPKFLVNFHRRQCLPHALVLRVNQVRSVRLMHVKDLERLRGVF